MVIAQSKTLAQLAGYVVIVGSGLALFGWMAHSPLLENATIGLRSMKANTAFGMLLCGISLVLMAQEKSGKLLFLCSKLVALTTLALGVSTLGEYVTGRSWWIDEFFTRDTSPMMDISHPGRMSPASAFCFVLVGTSLWLVQPSAKPERLGSIIPAAFGATVTILGGAVALGQITSLLLHYRLWNYFGMALQTGLSFALLGSGLLLLNQSYRGASWVLGKAITAWFGVAIVIVLFVAGISWNSTRQLQEVSSSVGQAYQALGRIQEVRAIMANLESSQRGYLLLGMSDLLEFRAREKEELSEALTALKVSAEYNQRQHLEQLQALINQRIAFGEESIDVRRVQGQEAAQRMLNVGTGIALTAKIEVLLKTIAEEENALLIERQSEVDIVSTHTFLFLTGGVLLSLTIVCVALFSLNAEFWERIAAEKSVAQLAAIVSSSNDAILGTDLNSIVTTWNAAAEEMFGYSAKEIIGQSIKCLLPLGREDEEVQIIGRIKRGEAVKHFETVRQAKDGRQIDVSVTVSPIKDRDGRVVGASKVARDISERKLAEQEIRQLNASLERRVAERTKELEVANKELEAFSYSVSHDLRSPVRAMNGFSQAVLEDYGTLLPEDGRRGLERIRGAAQRMGMLIDDLLSFSRLSRTPLTMQAIDTEGQVRRVLEGIRSQQPERDIEVKLGKLPPCQGSLATLDHVWTNLLSNAFKYTRRREKAVVEIGSRDENGEPVYYVRDNGAGFDMRYVHKLFGVFQRLHRADEFEGTGVGLAIVQRIVHRHQGRVWAESELNVGSTFYFTLNERTEHDRG